MPRRRIWPPDWSTWKSSNRVERRLEPRLFGENHGPVRRLTGDGCLERREKRANHIGGGAATTQCLQQCKAAGCQQDYQRNSERAFLRFGVLKHAFHDVPPT